MCLETPAFLLLKQLSIDDSQGAIETWRGMIGSKQPIRVEMIAHYHARFSTLSTYAQVRVELENGESRLCMLLSIEPAPHAVTTSLVVTPLELEPEPEPERAPKMEQLYQDFLLRCCAQDVLQNTPTNLRFFAN
jgi:hypothetical protein